ncbi:MAG: hydroxyacylglutathione hydrolase C-terminal domain-containing protein, partial [Methylococcales bacterium]
QLKALPPSTRVYCAHEYTLNNARFALSLEPNNACLQSRMAWVEQQRHSGQSTLPSTIAEELATNPFLREDSPEIQETLAMPTAPPLQVFTKIRQLKDQF